MEIYLDTANINDIKKISNIIKIEGITTNPSLIARECSVDTTVISNPDEILRQIFKVTECSVNVNIELMSLNVENAQNEIKQMMDRIFICPHTQPTISKSITFKVPATSSGYEIIKILERTPYKTNATLVFTPIQALIASKNGASYVSIFVGRLDDIPGESGIFTINKTRKIFDKFGIKTKIIAASIRNIEKVEQAFLAGADIVTVPPKIVYDMMEHYLTKKGMQQFDEDWRNIKSK